MLDKNEWFFLHGRFKCSFLLSQLKIGDLDVKFDKCLIGYYFDSPKHNDETNCLGCKLIIIEACNLCFWCWCIKLSVVVGLFLYSLNFINLCSAEKGNLGVPQLPGQGCSFHSFRTNTYKLSFMESPSGIKVS